MVLPQITYLRDGNGYIRLGLICVLRMSRALYATLSQAAARSVRMIDLDALDRIADEHKLQRKAFPSLGTRYVAGEGDNPEAFIIGEAPGATEEIQGRPFVGQAGQVLRDLMSLAGFYATPSNCGPPYEPNCWLTNVLKFRPPKNRAPTEAEIKLFRTLLMDEWAAVGSPKLIIPVGGIALRAVTGKPISILRAAGKHHTYMSRQGVKLDIWPMVHPSFGLRTPPVQPLLEQDWDALGKWRRARDL